MSHLFVFENMFKQKKKVKVVAISQFKKKNTKFAIIDGISEFGLQRIKNDN